MLVLLGLLLLERSAAIGGSDAGVCPPGEASFSDVPSDHFAVADVGCLVALGIARGTSADAFSPDLPVSRAQTAAFLARMWRKQGGSCAAGRAAAFADVPSDHFAVADVGCLVALGIARGTSADAFSPDLPVSRAQTAAFLARMWRKQGGSCAAGRLLRLLMCRRTISRWLMWGVWWLWG